MSNLAIYELTEEQESTTQKIYSIMKPLVPSSPAEAVFAVGAAASGIFAPVKYGSMAVGAYYVYKDLQGKAKKINREAIEKNFKNANENIWVDSQYYIQHPKKKRARLLIEADSFVRYIEDERLGEIIDYLEREGRFNQIVISTSNKNGFKGKLGTPGFSIPLLNKDGEDKKEIKLNAKVEASGKTEINNEIKILRKRLPPCSPDKKPDYVWINSFKKLKSAVEGSKGTGECEIKIQEEFVNDFTIDASLASTIKLDFNVETDRSYMITIEAKRTYSHKRRARKGFDRKI